MAGRSPKIDVLRGLRVMQADAREETIETSIAVAARVLQG